MILGIVDADTVQSCRVLEKAGYVRHREEIRNASGRAATIVIYRYAPALRAG